MPDDIVSLKHRIEELEEIHRLAQSLSSIASIYKTLEEIGDCCLRLCRAERVAILLVDPLTKGAVHSLVRGFSAEKGEIDHLVNSLVAGWVIRHRQPLLSEDVIETLSIEDPTDQIRKLGPALAIPLVFGNDVIGVINLVNSRERRSFTNDDARLLSTIAPLASQFIQRAQQQTTLSEDNQRLLQTIRQQHGSNLLIGESKAIKKVRDTIAQVAGFTASVFLMGETGTGKELAAKAIHYQSARAGKPFLAVNCAAIPENLFESELFGHERGAFTGATEMKKGKFELAHEGTLFLDEISALPLGLQAKLLRVLEERSFTRVGSSIDRKVDVRLISATNKDLREASRNGDFREDLYHRLNVIPILLPSLRERREDIPLLASNFLEEFSHRSKRFSADALEALSSMEWRGNVRELRNCVERISILMAANIITRSDLQTITVEGHLETTRELTAVLQRLLRTSGSDQDLSEFLEKNLVALALQEAAGNMSKAARLLGIHRNSLQRRLEKYNLEKSVAPE
jgi:transcriptional regulator with GAF, ATPase, and Fis domain